MITLKAFALGAISGIGIAVVLATTFTIIADVNGWDSTGLGIGGLTIWEFERVGNTTTNTYGPGLLLAPPILGALNSLGSIVIRRRVFASDG